MVTRARDPEPPAREIEHAADVGLEIEAPTLPLLFERAGIGMLALMADLDGVEARARVTVAAEADGLPELLHDWLQALLVRFEADGFVACELTVEEVSARAVRGSAAGEPFDPARHRLYTEIKGVTYHALEVGRTADGWRAVVIFDV